MDIHTYAWWKSPCQLLRACKCQNGRCNRCLRTDLKVSSKENSANRRRGRIGRGEVFQRPGTIQRALAAISQHLLSSSGRLPLWRCPARCCHLSQLEWWPWRDAMLNKCPVMLICNIERAWSAGWGILFTNNSQNFLCHGRPWGGYARASMRTSAGLTFWLASSVLIYPFNIPALLQPLKSAGNRVIYMILYVIN